MLKKMIIENFKCFKNRTIFDFKRTNYQLLERNVSGKILKGALFVGDNASGKTTAIQPIRLLLDLLFKDQDADLNLYTCLFSKEPVTYLQYEFEIDGHEIQYAYSFKGNRFVEEKLQVDRNMIIERSAKTARLKLTEEEVLHEVDSSILFLKQVYFNTKFVGNTALIKWFSFLRRSIYINAYSRNISTYNGESMVVSKYLEKYGVEKINYFFEKNNFQYSIQYTQKIEKKGIKYELSKEEGEMVFFERKGIGVPIPIFMESVGNQTLINILPAILSAVESGGMLIIDEFSSGLHNKLEELLVKYIMRTGEAVQFFFVSHSTNLLSNSILRPDQIYTVEMMGSEGSKLHRFSDEQPRAAQNLEKMYLSGVFGGVPEYETNEE